jgi:hypothetical protein
MQTLKELQAEYQAQHPSVEFVIQPELGVPYPLDKDAPTTHYWGWIGFVQARGEELAKAAGVYEEAFATTRVLPEHKDYQLWLVIPWYEVLVNQLTGRFGPASSVLGVQGPTLEERDTAMRIKIRQLKDLEAKRSRIMAALAECDAEILTLKS